jgi:translation initiation factor 3 subunit M
MSVSVFIDISLEQQTDELRSYLKGLGANISEEASPTGVDDDILQIISVCDFCFKESTEVEIEGVLNSIVSMLIMVHQDRAEKFIQAFCEKVINAPSNRFGHLALRVLNLLYNGLNRAYSARYHVYYYLIRAAIQAEGENEISKYFKDLASLTEEFVECPPTVEQMQRLYRLLHEGLVKANKSELASKIMVELLSTYSSETAPEAQEDAKKCVLASLADPKMFLMDHLLPLKPVKLLEGQLIHKLLLIFVNENLGAYMEFYNKHKDFIASVNLDHDVLVKKIRMLTFMSLAGEDPQMSFGTIRKELNLDQRDEAVEEFVIEVLKTQLVKGRMDQQSKKVMINSTVQRTFGPDQWRQLQSIVYCWRESIRRVEGNMKNLEDLVPQQGA